LISKLKFSEEHIRDFINLLKDENLLSPNMKDEKFVKWKFCENPNGNSNYFIYHDKNEIFGRIMSCPYPGKVFISGKENNSYCLSDLYLKKKFRNPITNLINLYKFCIKNSEGIIFHSSNKNSEMFYKKILRNKIFFSLLSVGTPLSFRPFKIKNFLAIFLLKNFLKFYFKLIRILNFFICKFNFNFLITESDKLEFEKDLNNIQEQLKKTNNFFLRDKNFFEWRYKVYNFKKILRIYKDGKLIGYITLIEAYVMNLKNLIILDIQFTKNLGLIGEFILKFKIIQIGLKFNFDTIYSLGNKNNQIFKQVIGFPFFKIPDNFLPHSNPMFIHNYEEKDRSSLEIINFTISDFDYF